MVMTIVYEIVHERIATGHETVVGLAQVYACLAFSQFESSCLNVWYFAVRRVAVFAWMFE